MGFIDLFCGCGGLSRGLMDVGLKPIAAYDANSNAVANYNLNIPDKGHVVDIANLHLKRGVAPIIVAGLPCQSFSTLGKMDPDDPRNELWRPLMRTISEAMPIAWAIENVSRFLNTQQCVDLLDAAHELGYKTSAQVVDALTFGVPQKRRRAVIFGSRTASPQILRSRAVPKTVRDAFRGLPLNPDGVNLHAARFPSAKSVLRYRSVPPGGSRLNLPRHLQNPCWRRLGKRGATNVFGRLVWDQPADTVRTTFLKPETGRYIHPVADRGLTLREGMRLQGFQDTFKMEGAIHECAAQIGNAVPIPLGWAIGRELYRLVNSKAATFAA